MKEVRTPSLPRAAIRDIAFSIHAGTALGWLAAVLLAKGGIKQMAYRKELEAERADGSRFAFAVSLLGPSPVVSLRESGEREWEEMDFIAFGRRFGLEPDDVIELSDAGMILQQLIKTEDPMSSGSRLFTEVIYSPETNEFSMTSWDGCTLRICGVHGQSGTLENSKKNRFDFQSLRELADLLDFNFDAS